MREHEPALDGVRGLAVLLVVAHHWELPRAFPVDRGLLGVRLFFVLSGFLITSILMGGRDALARGETTTRLLLTSFYARRVLRIFPLYYAVLAALWAFDAAGVRAELPWHLAYATSLLVARYNAWIGLPSHLWSLSVEEHFYLLWPWAVLLTPARRLPAVVAGVIAAGVLWRTLGLLAGLRHFSLLYVLPGCLDALGVGALLACVHREHPSLAPRARALMLALGAALLGAATLVTRGAGATVFSHLVAAQKGLAYALLLGALVSACARARGGLGRAMSFAPLVYVGRVSYAVYLVHPMVPYALRGLGVEVPDGPLKYLAWAAVTMGVSAASWRWFEGPLNARKSRFPYRTAAARAPR